MANLNMNPMLRDQMNQPDRGPWTYFCRTRPVGDNDLMQQYAVEAPKDVAEEMLVEYLAEMGLNASLDQFSRVKTEADLNADHAYGAPGEIHINILPTNGRHTPVEAGKEGDEL